MSRLHRWYYRWLAWWTLPNLLNRRAKVEQRLFDAVCGKKPIPDAEECRELALQLGVSGR